MNTAYHIRAKWVALIAAASCGASSVQADLTYVLQPGSTITPLDARGYPSGPGEPLTGTFTWEFAGGSYEGGSATFYATSLSFQSESFLLTLDPAHEHDGPGSYVAAIYYGSSSGPVSRETYFRSFVDWGGMPGVPLAIWTTSSLVAGTFEGPPEDPVLLSCPQLLMAPEQGGVAVGILSFVAVQVPEPVVWQLASTLMSMLAIRRLVRRFA